MASFFTNLYRPPDRDESVDRAKSDESQIQPVLADMEYVDATSNRRRKSRGAPPRRKSLSANQRMRMNEGDAAVQFKKISEQLDNCHKTMMQELRSSNMSMKKKLDFALKKRKECADSRAELHFEEEEPSDNRMNGGRRKRRRKTRRKKKRKSRRKSRKRKRKTTRRR